MQRSKTQESNSKSIHWLVQVQTDVAPASVVVMSDENLASGWRTSTGSNLEQMVR
jgi:hypothetical protein